MADGNDDASDVSPPDDSGVLTVDVSPPDDSAALTLYNDQAETVAKWEDIKARLDPDEVWLLIAESKSGTGGLKRELSPTSKAAISPLGGAKQTRFTFDEEQDEGYLDSFGITDFHLEHGNASVGGRALSWDHILADASAELVQYYGEDRQLAQDMLDLQKAEDICDKKIVDHRGESLMYKDTVTRCDACIATMVEKFVKLVEPLCTARMEGLMRIDEETKERSNLRAYCTGLGTRIGKMEHLFNEYCVRHGAAISILQTMVHTKQLSRGTDGKQRAFHPNFTPSAHFRYTTFLVLHGWIDLPFVYKDQLTSLVESKGLHKGELFALIRFFVDWGFPEDSLALGKGLENNSHNTKGKLLEVLADMCGLENRDDMMGFEI